MPFASFHYTVEDISEIDRRILLNQTSSTKY